MQHRLTLAMILSKFELGTSGLLMLQLDISFSNNRHNLSIMHVQRLTVAVGMGLGKQEGKIGNKWEREGGRVKTRLLHKNSNLEYSFQQRRNAIC